MKLEDTLLQTLLKKQDYPKTFSKIVESFEKKLNEFDPVKNSFPIEQYFSNGNGKATILKKLITNNILRDEDIYTYKTKSGKNKVDVKGLYVFIYDKTPFYVGISRGIIHRTLQHLRGKTHTTSTLAYNIGTRSALSNEINF